MLDAAMVKIEDTLAEIDKRMEKLGDLPVFSASVNHVRRISSDAESSAMSLAMEIMKDANLSAKLLQLANSPYYNRGKGSINSVSRAVITLGFETIRSLCLTLKLIDSFQGEYPDINMNAMLLNSFLTAGMAREVGERAGVKDIEQGYVCGLLHGLGEIVLAYTLPEQYLEMQRLEQQGDLSWTEIQDQVLGDRISTISQRMAEQWGFPTTVVKTLEPFKPNEAKNRFLNESQVHHVLAAHCHSSIALIYNRPGMEGEDLGKVMQTLSDIVGVKRDEIESSLNATFKDCCELIEDYGLQKTLLMPPVRESGDPLLDKTSRQFAYFAGSRNVATSEPDKTAITGEKQQQADIQLTKPNAAKKSPQQEPGTQQQTKADEKSSATSNATIQLDVLQQITALMSSKAGIHHIFAKVVEGINKGVGFDRVMLCLLSSDHKYLQGRLGFGDNVDEVKNYLNIPIQEQRNLFIKVLKEGNEICVNDVTANEWRGMLPESYKQTVSSSAFIIGSIRANQRPVGLFYADNGPSMRGISEIEKQGFIQFLNQARLALQIAG